MSLQNECYKICKKGEQNQLPTEFNYLLTSTCTISLRLEFRFNTETKRNKGSTFNVKI